MSRDLPGGLPVTVRRHITHFYEGDLCRNAQLPASVSVDRVEPEQLTGRRRPAESVQEMPFKRRKTEFTPRCF